MRLTIIGSFRKYYKEICEAIDLFENNGVKIMSPQKSFIVNDIDGFVILDTDERQEEPYRIQERVFDNIEKSVAVYVWNPAGYLGNSTCYEIGKVMEKGKPIFFKEYPNDLPIRVGADMVKDIDEMIYWLCAKGTVCKAQDAFSLFTAN